MRFVIRNGVDLDLPGPARGEIDDALEIARLALRPPDLPGLRPVLRVSEGEAVSAGQPLFEDRSRPGVPFVAPTSGRVAAIRRGARRRVDAVVIEPDGRDDPGATTFPPRRPEAARSTDPASLREFLLRSGLWSLARVRPFGGVPAAAATPRAVIVRALDSRPLAASPAAAVARDPQAFVTGLAILARIADGPLWVTARGGDALPDFDIPAAARVDFDGPHPAGLVGTHIDRLALGRPCFPLWYLDAQDVLDIGIAWHTGRPSRQRVVACAGNGLAEPRLLRTWIGANTGALAHLCSPKEDALVLSGCVLSGRKAAAPLDYLGLHDRQVTALAGPPARTADASPPSVAPPAVLPTVRFEDVFAGRAPIVPLLRALAVGDAALARRLGCLALEEEDLALCSYVCPSGNDYGRLLRSVLDRLEEAA
jgi:Na+-transporting NADH:ubiquinone oxidoreductase subunit A